MQVHIDRKTQAVKVKPTASELTRLTNASETLSSLCKVESDLKDAAVKARDAIALVLALLRGEVETPKE